MINPDTMNKRSDNSLLTVFNILNARLNTEYVKSKPSLELEFMVNRDLILTEIEKRGLNQGI